MTQIIIHHCGVFNLYSTVTDAPVFEEGVSEADLRKWYLQEHGARSMSTVDEAIERARTSGTSLRSGRNLPEVVQANRAGEAEEAMPVQQFIEKYLTLCSAPGTREFQVTLNHPSIDEAVRQATEHAEEQFRTKPDGTLAAYNYTIEHTRTAIQGEGWGSDRTLWYVYSFTFTGKE